MKQIDAVLWFAIAALTACSAERDTIQQPEDSEGWFEDAPPPLIAGMPGDANYCTASSPCAAGFGDCNVASHCQADLICANDKGSQFGWSALSDVCLPAHCDNGVQDDADGEEQVDCGGECGTCPTCPDDSSNGAADFCSATCPGSSGQGDCDNHHQCDSGLVCGVDIGLFYGMAKTTDVCVPVHCANGVMDSDEELTDCGGADCGECLAKGTANGSMAFCSVASPCTNEQGDCDNNAQCVPGTQCVLNVGATYGFPAYVDVCESLGGTCTDREINQGELGVDCGGPCAACGSVAFGMGCTSTTQCASGICADPLSNNSTNGRCVVENSCKGDCGGASNEWNICYCDNYCIEAADCCLTFETACYSACFDGEQSQGEEGVDCGGACGPC